MVDVSSAIRACAAVLPAARCWAAAPGAAASQQHLELEVRLRNVPPAFFMRVSDYFDAVQNAAVASATADTSGGVGTVSPWTFTDDFASPDGLRSSRTCETGGFVHVRKRRLAYQDLHAVATAAAAAAAPPPPPPPGAAAAAVTPPPDVTGVEICPLRVSLSTEQPVQASELPFAVTLTTVRRKVRRSLRLAHWRVDITKVWSGGTLAAVQHAFVSQPPTSYEIEVEALDLASLLREKTDEYIVHDALLKSVALFKIDPRWTVTLRPVPCADRRDSVACGGGGSTCVKHGKAAENSNSVLN
jgi:hypothetical protein